MEIMVAKHAGFCLGVTAGASTPDITINEVVEKIKQLTALTEKVENYLYLVHCRSNGV